MSIYTKRDWTPVRRGKLYCAPACGGKCTWAAYQAAKRRADEMAKQLGPGWRGEVWENLGWYYQVTYEIPDGKLDVRENDQKPKYTCYLNAMHAQFIGESNNLLEAVRRCVKIGHERLRYIAGLVTAAHVVAARLEKE